MNYFFQKKENSKKNNNIQGNITTLSNEGYVYNENYINGRYNLYKISINKKDFYLKSINENFLSDYKIGDLIHFEFYQDKNKFFIIEDTIYKKIKPKNKNKL